MATTQLPVEEAKWIPGGTFTMGSDDHFPDEAPARQVTVKGFWMDPTPVTNDQFAAFVDATGFQTVAEIAPRAEDYPGALPENLVAGSAVFEMTTGPVPLHGYPQWWHWVPGADWRHPAGPNSSIDELGDHPVVHVAYADVVAYCAWADKTLPTEAEWEFAARGGLEGAEFVWGDEDPQDGDNPVANTWQGRFPYENTAADGWVTTAPVLSYAPNGFGLYQMTGNVWEWTDDWYVGTPSTTSCCSSGRATEAESYDPDDPNVQIPRKVLKGGSHLCTRQYCFRYRPAARHPQMVDSGTSHIGFRCITRPG